jgi:Protein of unknown function (DUF2889)
MDNKGYKAGNASGDGEKISREELHHRRIDIRGFRRSDGLFEVEGQVVDRKSHDQQTMDGRNVPAGDRVHDMGVRLVFDEHMVVRDVQTFTYAAPYEACPAGGLVLQDLKGLRLASGWNKEVRDRISKSRSCTHLVELLAPLATVAFQSLSALRRTGSDALDANGRPAKIDSCYAYAADGDLVSRRWPDFYKATSPKE